MQAVYIEQYGTQEALILGEQPTPSINQNQVLIKVQGAGVNPVDWMVRSGLLESITGHTLPLILGWDISGEVFQVGSNVKNVKVGDSVFAYVPITGQGAYAQYAAIDSELVALKPTSLDSISAAAVPLAATTAWQTLMQGCKLKSGDKVLIHNAAGGVGSFAVQIAKAMGAYVIGTASAKKEQFVKGLGADEFIDYTSQRFEDTVDKVDAVLAAVGGDDILMRSLDVIKEGGYLVSLLEEIEPHVATQLGVNYQHWWVTPNAQDLQSIAQLIDAGKIHVPIEKIFPIQQVAQAHTLSESQRATGKIVLDITSLKSN